MELDLGLRVVVDPVHLAIPNDQAVREYVLTGFLLPIFLLVL